MKKPLVNLAAIERIDALPLRKALELHQKAAGEIAAGRVRETALAKEINDYLESVNPDDEKAVQLVAGKKIQQEVLPRLIAKVERQLADEITPTLLREADAFKGALCRFYRQANDAVAQQLAEMFRPFFAERTARTGDRADMALTIASQSDDCMRISARLSAAELIRLPEHSPRSNNPTAFDRELIEGAQALLALAEKN